MSVAALELVEIQFDCAWSKSGFSHYVVAELKIFGMRGQLGLPTRFRSHLQWIGQGSCALPFSTSGSSKQPSSRTRRSGRERRHRRAGPASLPLIEEQTDYLVGILLVIYCLTCSCRILVSQAGTRAKYWLPIHLLWSHRLAVQLSAVRLYWATWVHLFYTSAFAETRWRLTRSAMQLSRSCSNSETSRGCVDARLWAYTV